MQKAIATISRDATGLLVLGTRWTQMARNARQGLPAGRLSGVHFCRGWREAVQSRCRVVYVVASLGHLTGAKELAHLQQGEGPEFRFLAFVDDLPIESIPERMCRLQVRSDRRVHLARTHGTEAAQALLVRFVTGLCGLAADSSILDAWWEGGDIVVLSAGFKRLRVPLSSLPGSLRGANDDLRKDFQIDEHGDFLYWPGPDVHLGWEQLVQAVDPMARLHAQQKTEGFNVRYGQAIRSLREASCMNQSEIRGLDQRTVRRIEQGETRVTANAIAKLAEAHGLDASRYLAEVSRYLTAR